MTNAHVTDYSAARGSAASFYPESLLPRLQHVLRDLAHARLRFNYESEAIHQSHLSPSRKTELAKALETRHQAICEPMEQRLREAENELRTLIGERGWD